MTLFLPADVVAGFVVVEVVAAVVVAVEDAGLVVVVVVVVVAGTAVVEAMDDPEHRLKDPEDYKNGHDMDRMHLRFFFYLIFKKHLKGYSHQIRFTQKCTVE